MSDTLEIPICDSCGHPHFSGPTCGWPDCPCAPPTGQNQLRRQAPAKVWPARARRPLPAGAHAVPQELQSSRRDQIGRFVVEIAAHGWALGDVAIVDGVKAELRMIDFKKNVLAFAPLPVIVDAKRGTFRLP